MEADVLVEETPEENEEEDREGSETESDGLSERQVTPVWSNRLEKHKNNQKKMLECIHQKMNSSPSIRMSHSLTRRCLVRPTVRGYVLITLFPGFISAGLWGLEQENTQKINLLIKIILFSPRAT